MHIPLDRGSETPLYRQIEMFIRQGILSGSLAPDTRLPAIRQLSRDLGVNRITIENAYAALEADNLVYSRVGSGTYVLKHEPLPPLPRAVPGAPWPLWQKEIQARSIPIRSQLPAEILATSKHPDLINFAEGIGDSQLFPSDDFRKVIQTIMRRDGISALEYGDRRGYSPLRDTISHVLATQGIQVHADNILITAGSQQAISLVAHLILSPGDVVLVESPTYSGVLNMFHLFGFKIVSVPVDQSGLQVEKLENILQLHHPKLIYTIPNFQNPTGTCLSGPRRHMLITLADRYNIPILEDDFVGDLRYEGKAQPALKALDPGGRVLYVSTFSKMLMPGLRVGFLIADGPVYDELLKLKGVNDLATSSLIQRALEAYVTVGRYQAHLRRTSAIYRRRRDAMAQAIYHYLPACVNTHIPYGGLFFWVQLPDYLSSEELLALASKEGVVFAPGLSFFPNGFEDACCFRLNFVSNPPERIEEGIRRLGIAIRKLENSQ
jgi:GntR family transcriptional regulator/MocR family aminotransferase